MPQGFFTFSKMAAFVALLVACSQISTTTAVETWQDPVDSNLRLYNSRVMSYFNICDFNESVTVQCHYAKKPCAAYSETSNFTLGNSTCIQIAFLHQKEKVVNGTVISLVIRDAVTFREIVHLSREFVLKVLDNDALCQCEPSSPDSSTSPSSQAATEVTSSTVISTESSAESGDAENTNTETSMEGSAESDADSSSSTGGIIPDTTQTLVEGIEQNQVQDVGAVSGASTENNPSGKVENDYKIGFCVFLVAFIITLLLLILMLALVVRQHIMMRRQRKHTGNIGNDSGLELNLSGSEHASRC